MATTQNEHELMNSFDKLANWYDDVTNDFTHEIIHYIHIQNMAIEIPLPNNEIKLLDLGGGTGKYSLLFSKLGYSVTLVDISMESLKIAEKKFSENKLDIKIINTSGEKLPLENDIFDIIVMTGGVINYSPNYKELLQECKRVLKKNGILYFDFMNSIGWCNEIPNANSRLEVIEAEEKLIQMGDWDYPARLFNCNFLEEMVIENGFKIKSKYGLINITTSLPLDIRYSKNYEKDVLERFKKVELEVSRNKECYGTSWSCIIIALK